MPIIPFSHRSSLKAFRAGALGVVAACSLGSGITTSSAAAVPYLKWKDCRGRMQCATVKVLLDRTKPSGRHIKLAVARRPASDPAKRLGSLFVNPGGPGESGVEFARSFKSGGRLNQRFDIVGFDPRGVGSSRPAIHCASDRELDEQLKHTPRARARNLSRFLANGAREAKSCRRNTPGWLLRHVSTADTARDMDLLRRAAGDKRLTYLGDSYGTELGAVYASLFPKRVRALSLDGGIDHQAWASDPLALDRTFARGNESSLKRFFRFCGTNPDSCPFVANADPAGTFDSLLADLDRNPIAGTAADPRPVNATLAGLATLGAMYKKEFWPVLGAGLAKARERDGAILRAMVSAITGRDGDGHYSNALAANLVITANDGEASPLRKTYARQLKQLIAKAPHFASTVFATDATIRKLPSGAHAYRKPLRYPDSSPTLLVVGSTRDPATPYASTRSLARQLVNARLLTRVGDGHTSGSSKCVADYVASYLIDRVLPAVGTTCAEGT